MKKSGMKTPFTPDPNCHLTSKSCSKTLILSNFYIFVFNLIISQCTVLQDGQFAALRKKYGSFNFLQIMITFATKTTNFVNFDYFSYKNGQNSYFLGYLLKIIKIFKNIPSL